MYRRFDVDTYRAESAGWNVEKFVNVAAATGRHSIDETIELDGNADADGGPDAIIGGLPPTDTVAEAVELLDRQMTAPRFRGVRPMGATMGPVPDAGVLQALQERNLLFELMTHPDQLQAAARQLAGLRRPDRGGRAHRMAPLELRRGAGPLAGRHRRPGRAWATTSCASSRAWPCRSSPCASMPSPRGSSTPSRPSASTAACSPATSRSTPMYGTFDELYATFSAVTAGLDDESRDKLFAANAERVYRC